MDQRHLPLANLSESNNKLTVIIYQTDLVEACGGSALAPFFRRTNITATTTAMEMTATDPTIPITTHRTIGETPSEF